VIGEKPARVATLAASHVHLVAGRIIACPLGSSGTSRRAIDTQQPSNGCIQIQRLALECRALVLDHAAARKAGKIAEALQAFVHLLLLIHRRRHRSRRGRCVSRHCIRLEGDERDQDGQQTSDSWHSDSPTCDEAPTVTEVRTAINDGTGCVCPQWALRWPVVATCHASAC
jgi:hypothetical protein